MASFQATIGARINEFMARMRTVQSTIKSVANDVSIDIGADVAKFQRKAAEVKAKALALARDKVVIKIEARIEEFQSKIQRIATNIRAFGELARNTFSGLTTSLLPAVVPLISNIGVAIANLGPMLGTVAGSTFALVGAFGAAGAAAVAFGAVAIPTIKDLFEENAKLTAQQAQAKASFDAFKATYNSLVKATEKPVLSAFQSAMTAANSLLTQLRPLFLSSTQAVAGLMEQLNKSIGTPPVQAFLQYLNDSGASMLATFGQAFGNVFKGLGSMLTAFAPLSKSTAQGFLEMTQRFAEWSEGLKTSDKFQSFMDYVATNMPKIRAIFRDATAGIVYFFSAFGDSSAGMMDGLVNMMARFKEWSRTLSENQGFQQFMSYVQQTTPSVLSLIGNLTQFIINLGIGLAPLGAIILNLVNSFLEFSNSMMENNRIIGILIAGFISFGGLALAIVPNVIALATLFKGFGTTIMGLATRVISFLPNITSLGTLFTGLATKAVPMLGTALGLLTSPVGLVVAGVTALGVAAFGVGVHLSQSSIQIQGWSDKVSESTAKAVGSFMDLSDKATLSLNQMAWGAQTVTQEMATNLINTYDQMGQKVLTEMQTDHAAQLQQMTSHFAQSSALTEEEEAEILAKIQESNTAKELSHQQGQERIKQILQTAADVKRAITEAEQKEINGIQEKMTENAVKYMSESQEEQKVILETLKAEASKITAEQAAEVVKNSVKQKVEVIAEAEAQYNDVVGEIIRQRDETGTISAEQADKLIEEAQRQRDETITSAEEMHEGVVSEAKAQAGEHVEQVNWETGEVKSKWSILVGNIGGFMKDIGKFISDGWNAAWKVTTDFVNDIATTISTTFNAIVKIVSDKMAEAKQWIELKWSEAQKFLEGIDLLKIGKDIVNGLISGITSKFEEVKSTISDLADKLPSWLKSMLGIKSPSRVMANVSKWVPLGVAKGIDDNTPKLEASVKGMAESIEETTRETLNARGSSRNMTDIGEDLVNGLIKGMEQCSEAVTDEAAKLANEIVDAFSATKSIDLDLFNNFKGNDTIAKAAEEYNAVLKQENELLKTNKELMQKRAKAADFHDYAQKTIERQRIGLEKRNPAATRYNRRYVQELQEDYDKHYAKLLKQAEEAEKAYTEESARFNEEKFQSQKSLVEGLKNLNALSILDEEKLYAEMASMYAKDSEQYKYFNDLSVDIRKEINEKLLSLNDMYTQKIQDANQKLIDGERKLNEEYEKSVSSRAQSLSNFAGIFDEVVAKNDISGQQLIDNLRSQNNALQAFVDTMASLGSRGIDTALLDELSALGPKSVGELQALNSLSDEQLNEYVALWREKSALARTQAEAEMVGVREDTDAQIIALREETAKQLEQYQTEWATAIQSLTGDTKEEMNGLVTDMPGIGANVIKGMQQGLSDMTPALVAQASSIAESIKTAIQSALDIHSPSRWGKKFIGHNLVQGIINGMSNMRSDAIQAAQDLADWVKPSVEVSDIINDISGAIDAIQTEIEHKVKVNVEIDGEGSNLNKGGGVHQEVHLHSPKHLSPSENARQLKRAAQQLAFK